MNSYNLVLKNEEKTVFNLRALYEKYGYTRYKINKFEEYDLYVRNKNFLDSESILTFTDVNGKLMALKPDVTLSIVKNTKDVENAIQKLYYNENVYRVVNGNFKEIVQTGLECIGDIDFYSVCEVIMLAAKSLESIDKDYILDISHIGMISSLLDGADISAEGKKQIMDCVGRKSVHEIESVCASFDVSKEVLDTLKKLISIYGPINKVMDSVVELCINDSMNSCARELSDIAKTLSMFGLDEKIYLDFSIVNDMNYYNGIIFHGFINGVASGILSGGRYDKLLERMGKESGAVGFAIYLDRLERINAQKKDFDIDVLLLYDKCTKPDELIKAVKLLVDNGKTVKTAKSKSDTLRYRQLLAIKDRGLEILETND